MKYKDIEVKQARQCCREHHKKDRKGLLHTMCDKCPLRRESIDKDGKIHNLFCWYVLKQFYEDVEEERKELEQEEIQYEKEWNEWVERLETEH